MGYVNKEKIGISRDITYSLDRRYALYPTTSVNGLGTASQPLAEHVVNKYLHRVCNGDRCKEVLRNMVMSTM